MISFVNLTPHPIVIRLEDGVDHVIEASGRVARVDEETSMVIAYINEVVPILSKTKAIKVIDLPERYARTAYIVSGLVAQFINREDVFSPATGLKDNAIRNEKGHIIAVRALKSTKEIL